MNIEKLKEQIEYAKKVKETQDNFTNCMDTNCKKVVKNYNTIMKNTKDNIKKLMENYYSNKMTEKQLITKIFNIIKKNIKNIKYTNYIKCLIKNCYDKYINLIFLLLTDDLIKNYILIKAKQFDIVDEVNEFLQLIRNQFKLENVEKINNLIIFILNKLYTTNKDMIITMIKQNKPNIPMIIQMIK